MSSFEPAVSPSVAQTWLDAMKKVGVPAKTRALVEMTLGQTDHVALATFVTELGRAITSADPQNQVRDVMMRQRVDNVFENAKQSYVLPDGSQTRAAPHFRHAAGSSGAMFGNSDGATPSQVRDHLRKLFAAHQQLTPAISKAITLAVYGRASLGQIRQLTQALIQFGELPATVARNNSAKTPEEQVRMLQWDHGIGLDCGGYTQNAFVEVQNASRSKLGLDPKVTNENMQYLQGNPRFKNIGDPKNARPGDVIVLADDPDGAGHVVLVRNQRAVSTKEAAQWVDPLDLGVPFALPGHSLRLLEVDSSFGAGKLGDLAGGVQRHRWIFNETTRQFAILKGTDLDVQPDGQVYGGHPFGGIFRVKD